jgi:hypothetical protein
VDDQYRSDADRGIESDNDPHKRRIRLLVLLGIPSAAAATVLVMLGFPWWLVLVILMAFVALIVLDS